MRHAILILMVALLPLRGWASESMVVSMAVQQLVAANGESALKAQNVSDCPFVDQMARKSTTRSSSQPISPLCKGCTTCQLCMALVTGYAPMPPIAAHLQHTKLLSSGISFTSAEHAPRFKPPIS